MNTRAKWAYLSYDSIQTKIDEGVLDAYDVIYTKDSHENVIISPDLEIWSVRSRIYVFNSVEEANIQLNINTDTYIGQIVSIIIDEVCKGYIVNKDREGSFYVEALTADNIDYNTLGNRPVENLVGTLDEPVIITELNSGTYKIKGQYKISDDYGTVFLSSDGDLFLTEKTSTENRIKRITKDTIQDFVVSDSDIVKRTYITDEYLTGCGYTTTEYVDNKVLALEESIREDIEAYVEQTVEDVITQKVDAIIDERLDIKLDERIQETTNEEVEDLFK